jgi:hypothetical protein
LTCTKGIKNKNNQQRIQTNNKRTSDKENF